MSKLFNLNINDFLKGLILAILTAILTIIYNTIQAGSLNIDWKLILMTTITTILAYLLKNLCSNSSGEILTKDKK